MFGAAVLHVLDLWSPAVLLEVLLPARVVDGSAAASAVALHLRKRLVLLAAEGAAWSLRSERRHNAGRAVLRVVSAKKRPTGERRERRESRSVVGEDLLSVCVEEAVSSKRPAARRFLSRVLRRVVNSIFKPLYITMS